MIRRLRNRIARTRINPLRYTDKVDQIGISTIMSIMAVLGWDCNPNVTKAEEGALIDIKCSMEHARIEMQLKTSTLLNSTGHQDNWCFNIIRGRENRKTKERKYELNTDFYGNPENFLVLVGLEATRGEITRMEDDPIRVLGVRRHAMLIPGKDVIDYFRGKSEKSHNLEFSARPFFSAASDEDKATCRWLQYEADFGSTLKEELTRQEAEYRLLRKLRRNTGAKA